MNASSIRKYLRTYKVYGRGSTSVSYYFAAAIADRDVYDAVEIAGALRVLGQDPENLSCVYCDRAADGWDHLVPVVKDGRQFGPGHRVCNLVPCCSRCNAAKGNEDFEAWLPGWTSDGRERAIRLKAYLSKGHDPDRSVARDPITEAALAEYWRTRDMIFDLMRHADTVATRIRALRGRPQHPLPAPAPPPGPPTRPPRRGIGVRAKELLASGWPDAAIREEIRRQFPGAKTTKNCLAYYRCEMKRHGALPDRPTEWTIPSAPVAARSYFNRLGRILRTPR